MKTTKKTVNKTVNKTAKKAINAFSPKAMMKAMFRGGVK